MFKKIILPLVTLVFVIIAGVTLFEHFQKPEISNTLSQRSLDFIESQKAGGDGSKYSKLLEEKKEEDFKGKRIDVDDCFSFVMPYSVFNNRAQGECNEYFAFENPRGTIVAFMKDATDETLDSAPGVSMRRLDPGQYEEREMVIGGRKFLGFVDKEDEFSITVYGNIDNKYLVFTLKLPEENPEDLENILSSLEFN